MFRAMKSRRGTRAAAAAAAVALLVPVSVYVVARVDFGRADTRPANPTNPATPPTVSADPLPTVQIDGVVWSQAVVGNRVFAGGSFANARPAGSAAGVGNIARANLLAYDITTGNLDASFAPVLNAQARVVASSPDGSRVYVGGDFTTVNGETRSRIAAFDTATGSLVASFAPNIGYHVYAIAVTPSVVYVGGNFQGVGTASRSYLAAFRTSDGALLDWAPAAGGGMVNALAVSPDGSKVAVGGRFTSLNGSSNPGYGLGFVDATTGALLPMAANSLIRNAGANSAITSFASDGGFLFGTGFTYASGGILEGSFKASWSDGTIDWIEDCHGDSYSTFVQADAVYVVGHPHYCGNVGGFPQGNPWYFRRALAFSKARNRHDHQGAVRLLQLGGQPVAVSAHLVSRDRGRHLHGSEPGPLARHRQRAVRRHRWRVPGCQRHTAAGSGPLRGAVDRTEQAGAATVPRRLAVEAQLLRRRTGAGQLEQQLGS